MTSDFPPGMIDHIRELYPTASRATFGDHVQNGYLSHNFVLRNDAEQLFLKQYRFDLRSNVEEIHRVKYFFANGGIPIILPFMDKTGKTIFDYAGRLYSLFPFVHGKIIKRTDKSSHAFASAGAMLGKMHALSLNGHPDIIHDEAHGWNRKNFLQQSEHIGSRIKRLTTRSRFDALALEALDLKRQLAQENDLNYEELGLKNNHIIHGDYHGQNIFYDESDEVKYVFDLEKTKRSPRVLEIVRSMNFMCFSNQYGKENFAAANTYLQAYHEIYPLDKDELIRGIRAYLLNKTHSLWIEKEHYINKNLRVDCFLESEIEMLRWYTAHFENFVGALKI